MSRTTKDSKLGSPEARRKLAPRGKPFWRSVEAKLHLGYRKLPKGKSGTWWSRRYLGFQRYAVDPLGAADDNGPADGVAILSFDQAQKKAREMMVTRAHAAAGKTGPLTVREALESYLDYLDSNKKSGPDSRCRYEAFIRDQLGDVEVNNLDCDQITAWHAALAKKPPRIRTKEGAPQRHRDLGKDSESIRRRKATANRTLTVLKAALNRAWRTKRKLVASDAEWRSVEPFENANAARIRYLKIEEATRLVNVCPPDFRKLVQAGLLTGCRYGELCRITAADFNPDVGTIAIMVSKTGTPRHVILTKEGVSFFRQLCAGRTGDELILTHQDGTAWKKSHQGLPMRQASARAGIRPAINFHALRHSWASLAVMGGMPILVVAKNLGHSSTRMVEKHYGHMAQDYVRKAIDESAPVFGFRPSTNVRAIR